MSAAETSAVDTCARTLREQILSGALPAGVRLPPERELADRFAVNRVTVRGALAQLASEHLVSVRQGSGYTVRAWRRTGGPDLIATLVALARSSKDRATIVRDLLLVRRHLARAIVERLAEGIEETHARAIEEAIGRLERIADTGDVAAIARADLEVAGAVVEATRSAVLALCFNPVASLLTALPRLQTAMFREPETNVAAWRALLAWARRPSRGGIEAIADLLTERDQRTVEAFERLEKKQQKEEGR